MLICPTVLSPLKLMDVLWGAEGRKWQDNDEVQDFTGLLMAYWRQLNEIVHDAASPDALPETQIIDIWEEDFPEQDGGIPMAAATLEWACGFQRATDFWPEAWGDALTRPDLAPHWEVVGWWAAFDRKKNQDRVIAGAEAEQRRTLNQSVIALARALRPGPVG